ncbi:restriction endonuclease subunit S [Bacillus pumilus]|uniref:restriction endonuclease subunit S n=1 Tax=Bacillus TaxID=1386 RepID=UPI003B677218
MSKNVPEVRFDGFIGEWEEKLLGNEVEFYSGLTYSPEDIVTKNGTLVLRSSNVKNGEIKDADNVYVNPSKVNSQKIKQGDVIVVVRNGSRQLIGKHATVKKNLDNTVIGAFMIGIRSENSNFTNALLDTTQFAIEINKNLGATINQITTGNFKKMKFFFPSNKEQQKIGTFFKQLDDTIALQRQLVEQQQQYKKAMLQKMFPQKGERVPKVRFDGFSGDWEERRAENIFKPISDKNHEELPVLSATQTKGMVYRDEVGIDIKFDEKSKKSYKRVIPNQFVIHLRSFQGGFAFSDKEGITSPAYTILDFKTKDQNNPMFWKEILRSRSFIKRLETVTYGIRDGRSISYSDFSTLKFLVPSLEEQQKIGTFFKQLDDIITLHEKKLEDYQHLKKALLQRMFV